MRELLPTILVDGGRAFRERLAALDGNVPRVQIDIADGIFVPSRTFHDPNIAKEYGLEYELDLMVAEPQPILESWRAVPGVKCAIIHAEITEPLKPLLDIIRGYGWKVGIAFNPPTDWHIIEPLLPKIDTVLFMTVFPGQNAAPFQPQVVPNIKLFHDAHPKIPVSVDGGVNEKTIPLLLKAGVTRFAAGNAIWGSGDPIENYKKLLSLIHHSVVAPTTEW